MLYATHCTLYCCIDSTFFVAFCSRHPKHTLEQVYQALGVTFHWPEIYFRFGFFLMVASLSSFFMLVMDVTEMSSCLTFCVVLIIFPMCFAMAKAMSLFELQEIHDESGGDYNRSNIVPR